MIDTSVPDQVFDFSQDSDSLKHTNPELRVSGSSIKMSNATDNSFKDSFNNQDRPRLDSEFQPYYTSLSG